MLKRTARITVIATLIVFLIVLCVLPTPKSDNSDDSDSNASVDPKAPETRFAIVGARVFDGIKDLGIHTVIVNNGVIEQIDSQDNINAEALASLPIIDGDGATLLPGLIDAHTHTFGSARQDAVRFGVTSMLDMFTDPRTLDVTRAEREQITIGDKADLFSAGMLATAAGGHGTQFGIDIDVLSAPEQATDWVRKRKAEGSDYIKLVYIPDSQRINSIDIDIAAAVIDAAHAQDMLAVAHISELDAAQALLDAGIDGLVHIFYDKPVTDRFIEQAKAQDLFVIPTMAITSLIDGNRPGMTFMENDATRELLTAAQLASLQQTFGITRDRGLTQIALDNVRRLAAAGIDILAGSDAPNPSTAHGVTLHQELALLVSAGLSPLQALQSATLLPATRFGLDARGQIRSGARADLLLVNGDPLIDIAATLDIRQIWRNGLMVERSIAVQSQDYPAMRSQLGDFDQGIEAPSGYLWTTTSDTMMGGKSSVELAAAPTGAQGSDGALRIVANVDAGFAFPWAGAFLAVANNEGAADMRDYSTINFAARGTPGRYRLMLFGTEMVGAPPTIEFDVNDTWQSVSLKLDDATGLDASAVIGLAWVTPMQAGDFTFDIDTIELLP